MLLEVRAGNTLLVIVNLDPVYAQAGWTDLDLDALGLHPGETYLVEDLLDWRALHLARPPQLHCAPSRSAGSAYLAH